MDLAREFRRGDRVIVRNVPRGRDEYEGKPGTVKYGCDERLITDWSGDLKVMPGYRIEFDCSWDDIRIPAVCVYPPQGE